MHPVLFKIGQLSVYSYGMMIALGFVVVTYLMARRANEIGCTKDAVIDLSIFLLVGGLIGGRLLYITLHLSYYVANPLEMLNFSKGGLVWYGGFLAGLIVFIVYTKHHKLRFWETVDFVIPYIALAQAFGRIGCFLNGCCYGSPAPADFLCGVVLPGEAIVRHPAQIYSAIALLVIFVVLRELQGGRHFVGEVFLAYCILYSVKRFLVENLRGDNPAYFYNWTLSQTISVIVLIVACILMLGKVVGWKRSHSHLK